MPSPQKYPLRAFTEQEERILSQIVKASSERVDTVKRAKALIAVKTGVSFAEAARRSGFKSADSVSQLIQRCNLKGLAALFIAPGDNRSAIGVCILFFLAFIVNVFLCRVFHCFERVCNF